MNDNFRYLDDLTEETRAMIFNDVSAGKKNLYHSVMACLQNRINSKIFTRNNEAEADFYIAKHEIPPDRQGNIRELVYLCYKRLWERGYIQN